MRLLTLGAKNEEIAEKTCMSINAVEPELNKLYNKINVKTRLQAVLWVAKFLK